MIKCALKGRLDGVALARRRAMWVRGARGGILVRPKNAKEVRLDSLRVRVRVGAVIVPEVISFQDGVVDELDMHIGTVDVRRVGSALGKEGLGSVEGVAGDYDVLRSAVRLK